eukprot:scaffold18813_cov55-Phaeocystis_antarctica.AAC.1
MTRARARILHTFRFGLRSSKRTAALHSIECSNSPPFPLRAGVGISSVPRARSPLGSSTSRASAASFVRAALEEGPQRSSIGARKKLAYSSAMTMRAQSSSPKREKSTITVKKRATHDPAVERVAARTEIPMEESIAWRRCGRPPGACANAWT